MDIQSSNFVHITRIYSFYKNETFRRTHETVRYIITSSFQVLEVSTVYPSSVRRFQLYLRNYHSYKVQDFTST